MTHVEQIKEKVSIVDIAGAYIKLEKAGGNFKALCPFHNEKTPSFFISPGRGSYYCFGCGMKGDIFSFVEEFEGVDFRGALKILADRAGIKLTPEDPHLKSEKERLYSCLETATSFFEEQLKKAENKKIVDYLQGRGLTSESISKWRIGFVKQDWHEIQTYLKSKKFTDVEIEKVGLIKKVEEEKAGGSRFYDRFRGRIMFPIHDSGGRVIGFSGRIFEDDGKSAKYLNSPETELFSKSKVLFGLDKAKFAIREKNETVLVEGQMDILLSHQIGIRNTVALSGTALTDEQVEIISRFSEKIIFAFDPDLAGVKASRRSAIIALRAGLEVKIAQLPKGEDPADFILKNKEKWEEILKNSVHIVYFSLEHILSQKISGKNLVSEIEENVFPFIFPLQSSMEKSHFIREIGRKTGLREEAILDDYTKAERKYQTENKEDISSGRPKESVIRKSHRDIIERRIYGIVLWQTNLKEHTVNPIEVSKKLKDITGENNFKKLTDAFSPLGNELILEAEVLYSTGDVKKDLEELFTHLEEDYLKKELALQLEELGKAERTKDTSHIKEILEKCKEISEKLSKLKKTK